MNKRLIHPALATLACTLAFAVVTPADAQSASSGPSAGACCVQSTSKLDALMNPVMGGDEKFFRTSAGTPNVILVLDSSMRMRGWARPWPTTQGCNHPEVNDLGYDPAKAYPSRYNTNGSLDTNWFDGTKFYDLSATGYGVKFINRPDQNITGLNVYTTAAGSCVGKPNSNDALGCTWCLQNRGYWIDPAPSAPRYFPGRIAGNFLNFNGPRDSGSNSILNRLVSDLSGRVRFSTVSLSMSGAGQKCWASGQGSIGFACNVFDFRSCSSTTVPSSAITGINSIEWWDNQNGTNGVRLSNPSGSSLLFAAAAKVRSKTPDAFSSMFPSCGGACVPNTNMDESSSNLGMCADCEFAAIIYISAGAGNAPNPLVTLPTEITDLNIPCAGCNPNDVDMPKVSKWFWENDLRLDPAFPSRNRVATYTIGFMDPATSAQDEVLLKRTALVGGGRYYRATSSAGLQEAIMQALDDISSRATSFSSASLSSVQTAGGDLAAILPRLSPQADTPWIGELYRFKQFNEFVEDEDRDGLNGKNDIFLLDRNGNVVKEDKEGALVTKGDAGIVLASEPYWEARAQLKANGHAARNIWTVIDSNNDGMFTASDTMKQVRGVDHAALAPYLGIIGTSHCPTASPLSLGRMIERFGFDTIGNALLALPTGIRPTLSAPPTQGELDQLCVKLLIQFVRGQDLADENANDDRTETRESVLADIFHSSPANVDPPVDRFLCELGLHPQCLRTLYATTEELGTAATPTATYADKTVDECTVRIKAAYDEYKFKYRNRDKLVLVGSNDGLLHAFHAGALHEEKCSGGFLNAQFDEGEGREVWAVIPPDQLPRLIDSVYGHQYMMDGDIMVRDIWADGSGATSVRDGIKQADEFHTVAIAAEGRGGVHYFALEVKFETDGVTASTQPKFLWLFPQPCTDEAALFGKSLLSFSPRPPPIGPVLIDTEDTSGSPTSIIASSATPTTRGPNDRPTVERWVTWLSGGWAPGNEKGRGIYLVDAWWGSLKNEGGIPGARKDNLWWKFEFDPTASGGQNEPRRHLTASVVAPVAMVDYGQNFEAKRDGFFDTGIVGDMIGQIWTIRHFVPGKLDTTTGLISNWAAARSFQMDLVGGTSTARRAPFQFLASIGLQPTNSALRVMMGTGDRYDLLADNAGNCQFDNPSACAKYGCGSVGVRYAINKAGRNVTNAQNSWTGRALTTSTLASTANSPPRDVCGSAGDLGTANAPVLASYGTYAANTCSNLTSPANPWPASLNQVSVNCGQDAAGNYRCEKTGNTYSKKLGEPNATALAGLGSNRYFGLWAYGAGGGVTRIFDEDQTTAAAGFVTAAEFDAARFSDRTTADATKGDLKNVTSGLDADLASADGKGWFYEYSALNRKTASAGTLIAGCALWNGLFPQPPVASQCPDNRQAQKMLFQANYVTGGVGCAIGFGADRFSQTPASAPPPEPVSIIQVSKTGEIRRSALVGDGIQAQPITVTEQTDVLQSLYEIPISESLHRCRHLPAPAAGSNCDFADEQQLMFAP